MSLGRFLFCFVLFGLCIFNTAYAQNKAGITLIPASIEKAADPGSTITETLTVTNESNEDKEFFLFKRNIKGVESGGVPVFAEEGEEKTGYEMDTWIDVQTDALKVPANSQVEVPVTINVPNTATPGSHFGGVFVSQEPPKLRQTGAGVGYEVASIVSIRISGDIIDTARIRSFSTDKLFYTAKHVNFAARIENQGNILIRPRGPLTITSIFGGKPESFMVNESLAGVFPGYSRDLEFAWDSDGLGFGRYEAILALVYDGEEGQKTIDASLVFWIFPLKIILSIIGGFASIIIIGYFLTRYYINQAIMRAAGGRRIVPQRYRKQVGVSRFTFVFTVLTAALVLFLLVTLILMA
jgi:hypothetical protein